MLKTKKAKLTVGVIILAVIVFGIFVVMQDRSSAKITRLSSPNEAGTDDWSSTIEYNGRLYRRNADLKTLLFMGVDDTKTVKLKGAVGNQGRTDTLMLFVLDRKQKEIRILKIPRDSIIDVQLYDDEGEEVYTGRMQINMQFAFGDGKKGSCRLTREKVESLLYGVPVNDYFALRIGAIAEIVDELGGITVTMEEDCTDISPDYEEGAAVHMNGSEAEHFVRYRDTSVTGSGIDRMDRQGWFLVQLFNQLRRDGGAIKTMIRYMTDHEHSIMTDVESSQLTKLTQYKLNDESLTIPGQAAEGNSTDEFHIDEEALKKLIVEQFYYPVD